METSLLYYPGYNITIKSNDKEIIQKYEESDFGFIQIVFEDDLENAEIKVEYTGTKLERICIIISISTVIILIIFICFRKVNIKT